MSQRATGIAILSRSVECHHYAHANPLEYAGEGHEVDPGVLERSPIERSARQRIIEDAMTKPRDQKELTRMGVKYRARNVRTAGRCMIALVVSVIYTVAPPLSTMGRATNAGAVIKMLDMPLAFQPNLITIKVGQSVEWENVGNEVHHATSDPSLAIKPIEVRNPPGAEPFDSGFLRPGETFTHTFTVPGEYRYTCVVHEAKGMIGTIVVIR